jgi:hypothetical protein
MVLGERAARFVEDPCADRDDVARLFRERDEVVRLQQPACRVVPSDECLEAQQRAGVELDDRLVLEDELSQSHRVAEVVLQLQGPLHLGVHPRREELNAVLALALGHVHREVGVAHQFVRRVVAQARRAADSQPDAACHGDSCVVDDDRVAQSGQRAFGQRESVSRVVRAEHDGELVTAEPSDRLPVKSDRAQSERHDAQQFVTCRVPERVVDDLEVVEVDEQHAHVAVVGQRDHPFEQLGERAPVGQTRQCVSSGLVAEHIVRRAQRR